VKNRTQLSPHALAIALLATIVFAMQTLGVAHRTAHAHLAEPAQELWLAVANGDVVSQEAWRAQQASLAASSQSATDPWQHHDTRADCERFDALCAGDAPIAIAQPTPSLPKVETAVARTYRALISVRTARANARAPPLA
jgi:hypothetical protein